MILHSDRHLRLQLFHLGIDHLTYLGDVRAGDSRDGDSQRLLTIVGHRIADRFIIVEGDRGDIVQTELILLMSLNDEGADVVHRGRTIAHRDADAVVAIIEITAIDRFRLAIQRVDDLQRRDTQVGHSVTTQGDVDTLIALAIDIDTRDTIDVGNLTFHELGIVGQLLVTHAITRDGIEHTEHIAKVVSHLYRTYACRQRDRTYLAAHDVPMLFQGIVRHGAE